MPECDGRHRGDDRFRPYFLEISELPLDYGRFLGCRSPQGTDPGLVNDTEWNFSNRYERNEKRYAMTKTLTAIAAAAALGLAAVAAPQPARAHDGGAVAAGVIGGLAAGAIIGSAAAHGPYYGGPYAYAPGPAYYQPACWWTRDRVWTPYGWRWHRVRVCR